MGFVTNRRKVFSLIFKGFLFVNLPAFIYQKKDFVGASWELNPELYSTYSIGVEYIFTAPRKMSFEEYKEYSSNWFDWAQTDVVVESWVNRKKLSVNFNFDGHKSTSQFLVTSLADLHKFEKDLESTIIKANSPSSRKLIT